uniref:Candidate secreted effector n=1 Tax=Meloidogyne incognita TaxID=6306 RepID=A0A914NXU3_MELIC
MCKWQFHCLLNFLNLLFQTANISVRFSWSLFQFHYRNHWIRVISQNTNNCKRLRADRQ